MFEIAIHNPRQHRQIHHAAGPLMLSRSQSESPLWNAVDHQLAACAALIEIEQQADGVALSLHGCEAECHCGQACALTGKCTLPLPAQFAIGDTRFEIIDRRRPADVVERSLQRLHADSREPRQRQANGSGPSTATLSRWFAALGKLNHWAMSLQELYVQAVGCAVEAIGLDGAIVCRLRDGHWEIAASHLPHPELGIHVDPEILQQVQSSQATLFHSASASDLKATAAVVVSPLRNSAGAIVGAIYGYRSVRAGNSRRGIRYLEAHWIELLAGAVSDAMLRLERDSQVDRRRVLLERTDANAANRDQHELSAQTREVTLLFADLRDFTRRAESMDMDIVYEFLGHVMDALTAAVMDHDGLVLDYSGDGLAAMWNAPADQADHAELACRAAIRMLESLPEVARNWETLIDGPLHLGVGVHTGEARVGNAGSRHRTKYGPRGANVNLTSRVEAATKAVGIPLLVTGAVASRLANNVVTHRVCTARLPGIESPVELFSAQTPAAARKLTAEWNCYEAALRSFESGDLHAAAEAIAVLDIASRELPAIFLSEQIQRELGHQQSRRSTDRSPKRFDGIITLATK
jgi:adenylate cyclase